jgi:hypothetical protein
MRLCQRAGERNAGKIQAGVRRDINAPMPALMPHSSDEHREPMCRNCQQQAAFQCVQMHCAVEEGCQSPPSALLVGLTTVN